MLTEMIHEYTEKLAHLVDSFAEEELKPYFSELFELLQRSELGALAEGEETATSARQVAVSLNSSLGERIPMIADSLIKTFSDPRTAVLAINVMFSQLQTAYHKFLAIHHAAVVGDTLASEASGGGGTESSPIPPAALEALLRQSCPHLGEHAGRPTVCQE